MNIILIPGLWLDGSSWADVAGLLRGAGHEPTPLTLPGMESPDADRGGIGLAQHVAEVVEAIDRSDAAEKVILVAHSAAAGVAHAAIDARPQRVARVIHVGGFPTPDGEPIAGGFPTDGDDIPLPDWQAFDEADLTGLSARDLAAFRRRAVPSPASLTTDTQRLTDPQRYEVPATVVCTEFASEDLVSWIDGAMAPVAELGRLRHLDLVDLPTGHWPQFTEVDQLAAIIGDRCHEPHIDEHGRLHPPAEANEIVTTLGFLDYQRETLEWKTRGLGSEGLNTRVAASDLTLGGLLKHMALVEDHWFSRWLHDRAPSPPWDEIDWEVDRDWEFTSSAEDTPDALRDLWRKAVLRSKALTAAAIAGGGLDGGSKRATAGGNRASLRWILQHMVEEYARHNGHADLLREGVDGETGE